MISPMLQRTISCRADYGLPWFICNVRRGSILARCPERGRAHSGDGVSHSHVERVVGTEQYPPSSHDGG